MIAPAGNENLDPEVMHRDIVAFLEEQQRAGADPDILTDEIGYPRIPEAEAEKPTDEERAEVALASGQVLIEHEASDADPGERVWTRNNETYYEQGYITAGQATEDSERELHRGSDDA